MDGPRIRFRPSCNGPLHLGSLYTAWQNWNAARARGGKFILIADATVPTHTTGTKLTDEAVQGFLKSWHEDLEWFGVLPDEWHRSDEPNLTAAHEAAVDKLGIPHFGSDMQAPGLLRYVWPTAESGPTCSYSPWLVAGRVTDDHELDISGFVRGADLIHECQLYDFVCWQLYGYRGRVLQEYVPILCGADGGKFSKSEGSLPVSVLREAGHTPEEIKAAFMAPQFAGMEYGAAGLKYAFIQLAQEWQNRVYSGH